MKKVTFIFSIIIILSSCIALANPTTIGQIKEGLICTEYTEGMPWTDIKTKLGKYDEAPIPEPGADVLRNSRVYKNMTVIFYTEVRDVKIGDKNRPQEMVYKVEICKEK
jgi:hypothetical protein